MAPHLPTPIVPTGIPGGICTIDSNASNPLSDPESKGTPITGMVFFEAITPGRAAARPAPAIITSTPFSSILLQ
jgi:hypothetical protein